MKSEKNETIALALTGVFSALLSIAAVASLVIAAALLSELVTSRLHAQTTPAQELQAAMTKEKVDGDLKNAISAYQKISADRSAPRDVRAKALLHLAGCYEKLGRQAQNLYQQIVRDYADQPAATEARTRLAALKLDDRPATTATMTQAKIETMGRRFGEGDTDGHRVVYLNRETGELIYGDLAGHSKRVIYKAKLDNLPGWSPSRDFSMVFLNFHAQPDQPQTFAVMNIDGTGYREIARLDPSPACWPNWSWDNRYLVCAEAQDSASRLVRISIADGQTRELLNLKGAKVPEAHFSPDGRFVAYQTLPSSPADPVSRIFVLPAEGGEPHLAYEERPTAGYNPFFHALKLLDWTADGRYLAIGSERAGKGALHLLPIQDGKAMGAPIFVRYGDFEYGQTTASGGLVYQSVKPGGAWVVYLASLDADGRLEGWKHLDLPLGNTLNPAPEWSGDGSRIVYVSRNEDAGQSGGQVVHLRNLSTGEDREIYHALGFPVCVWAAQEPKLFCSDKTETTEILSIAVESGEIVRLGSFPASKPVTMAQSGRDDRSLYLVEGAEMEHQEMLRWEIATGRETVLAAFETGSLGWPSRDERWLIRMNEQDWSTRPMAAGEWKPLVSHSKGFLTGHFNSTLDGKWLIYHDVDTAGKQALFRVPMAGGQPERVGDFPTNALSGTMAISPDGTKIMVSAGEYATGYELWSLENFAPPQPKR